MVGVGLCPRYIILGTLGSFYLPGFPREPISSGLSWKIQASLAITQLYGSMYMPFIPLGSSSTKVPAKSLSGRHELDRRRIASSIWRCRPDSIIFDAKFSGEAAGGVQIRPFIYYLHERDWALGCDVDAGDDVRAEPSLSARLGPVRHRACC